MNKHMIERLDGWMDGWKNGWKDVYYVSLGVSFACVIITNFECPFNAWSCAEKFT